MKFLQLTFLVALIGGLGLLTSCKPDEKVVPSIEEVQFKLLSKEWTVSEVRFGPGSTDRSTEYDGMKLTISDESSASIGVYDYFVSGRPALSPWPEKGTWSFDENEPESLIMRIDDGLAVSYLVTSNQLQLSFNYTGAGFAGRVSAVEGNWIFLFTSN